jgi:glycosyltransferase involved in cell wall biosynthesis
MLLTNTYDPDPRVRQEALTLLALGCRVRLLAWDRDRKSPATETIEGVEIERVQLASRHGRGTTQIFFYLALYLRMFWRGWRTQFDVVHCHDLDTLPLGWALGIFKRKRVVYDAHESFPDMLAGSVPAFVQRLLFRLENSLIRRVDLLITVGEKLRRHFEERGARRTTVVGNWKRIEEYSRTEEQNLQVRRRLRIPQDGLVVACITQLLKDRKITELLDAVDESPNVYALIGGKGVLEPLVRERAATNPRIIYLGVVPAAEIATYTCAADIIYYGFDPENPNARFSAPNKLYESVAAGRPLIVGDFGEIAEAVRNGNFGIVLPKYSAEAVRNALARLQDDTWRTALGANAAVYGRTTMNWQRGQQILHDEYCALLCRKAGASLA